MCVFPGLQIYRPGISALREHIRVSVDCADIKVWVLSYGVEGQLKLPVPTSAMKIHNSTGWNYHLALGSTACSKGFGERMKR